MHSAKAGGLFHIASRDPLNAAAKYRGTVDLACSSTDIQDILAHTAACIARSVRGTSIVERCNCRQAYNIKRGAGPSARIP